MLAILQGKGKCFLDVGLGEIVNPTFTPASHCDSEVRKWTGLKLIFWSALVAEWLPCMLHKGRVLSILARDLSCTSFPSLSLSSCFLSAIHYQIQWNLKNSSFKLSFFILYNHFCHCSNGEWTLLLQLLHYNSHSTTHTHIYKLMLQPSEATLGSISCPRTHGHVDRRSRSFD